MDKQNRFSIDIFNWAADNAQPAKPTGVMAPPRKRAKVVEEEVGNPVDKLKEDLASYLTLYYPEMNKPLISEPSEIPVRQSSVDAWDEALSKFELQDIDTETLRSVRDVYEMREEEGITKSLEKPYEKPKDTTPTTNAVGGQPVSGKGLMTRPEAPVDMSSLEQGVVNKDAFGIATGRIGVSEDQWDTYRNAIAKIESEGAGGYAAKGGANDHYDGRYQMGRVAKADAAQLLGMDLGHSSKDREAFRNDPELQERAFAAFTAKNDEYLTKKSEKYRGLSTEEKMAVLAYAHNQGWSKAKAWLETGEVGEDAFGTKGTKYSSSIESALREQGE